ncbi:ubiquitin-like protein 7 isoform X8 [Chelonia mydas]|uniref:ubiquitin-like protein 7 isoform X8 n=1 Tax=Chelonia mydas TaxID=8469 RepID=UPI001CA95578|nr:ubiquitin-like protein 7 isoform X8 [Chelonia mydas]
MSLSEWHIAVKLADQPLAPKSILRLPETELGECPLGGCSISYLKQLITGKLQESVPDPELIDLIYCGRKLKDDQTLDFYGIQSGSTVHVLRKSWPEPDQKPEPVDKVAAVREFRVLHTALHSSPAYRDAVFKMLGNKESLDQIIVATPGLSSDPVALGVLQDKDLFSVFADPNMLDTLIPAHPALVNAIILVLHSVAGSTPLPTPETSSRSMPSSSYRDMPGGFLFEGLSDDEDDFHQSTRSTPSSSTSGSRPASLGYTGAAGPRPITQSELATALALASTPESSSHTPTPGTQGHSSGTSPMSSSVQSGTPITNDLFSQALQHALQASGQPAMQNPLRCHGLEVHCLGQPLWSAAGAAVGWSPSRTFSPDLQQGPFLKIPWKGETPAPDTQASIRAEGACFAHQKEQRDLVIWCLRGLAEGVRTQRGKRFPPCAKAIKGGGTEQRGLPVVRNPLFTT